MQLPKNLMKATLVLLISTSAFAFGTSRPREQIDLSNAQVLKVVKIKLAHRSEVTERSVTPRVQTNATLGRAWLEVAVENDLRYHYEEISPETEIFRYSVSGLAYDAQAKQITLAQNGESITLDPAKVILVKQIANEPFDDGFEIRQVRTLTVTLAIRR